MSPRGTTSSRFEQLHWRLHWRLPCIAFSLLVTLLFRAASTDEFPTSREERLQSAVMLTPRKPKSHLDLVEWHLMQGDADKAMSALHYALEVDPEHAWRYHQRSGDILYEQRHDLNASEVSYREALRGNPRARRSLLRYGALRMWQGAREEANKLFADAVEAGLLRDARQRPVKEFLAELTSDQGPWIQADNYMLLGDAMEMLAYQQVIEELQKEYIEWASKAAQTAVVSQESDPKAPGRHLQFWIHRPYSEDGVWYDGCAKETPKICQALKSLNESGLTQIHSASFEILETGARARPKCHSTNAEFFIDVCLQAPDPSDRGNLVFTTADDDQRPWVAGDVSILDGSFEYSMSNSAVGQNAVALRLVVRHPSLPCTGTWDECGIRGAAESTWRFLKRIFASPPNDFGMNDNLSDEL